MAGAKESKSAAVPLEYRVLVVQSPRDVVMGADELGNFIEAVLSAAMSQDKVVVAWGPGFDTPGFDAAMRDRLEGGAPAPTPDRIVMPLRYHDDVTACDTFSTPQDAERLGSIPKATVGRTVHYVAYGTPGGEYQPEHRAAVVTDLGDDDGDLVGLAVLNPTGMFFNHSVPYDEGCASGTWHWPERS